VAQDARAMLSLELHQRVGAHSSNLERERAGICSVVSYLVSGIASVFPPPTGMFGDNLLVGVTVMSCSKLMSLREVKD